MRRIPSFWVYLLVSDRGETYAGYTGCLKRRLREHNSRSNRGWTRGRRWRVVEAKRYLDRASAVRVEHTLKRKLRRRVSTRWKWLLRRRERLGKLCRLLDAPNPLTRRRRSRRPRNDRQAKPARRKRRIARRRRPTRRGPWRRR